MSKLIQNPNRTAAKRTSAGRKIIAAFDDELKLMSRGKGGLFSARIAEVADDPGEYSPTAIVALRTRLGFSQALFAQLLGTSTVLVSSWEQGKRQPSRMARRLLDAIAESPERWAGMVKAKERSTSTL